MGQNPPAERAKVGFSHGVFSLVNDFDGFLAVRLPRGVYHATMRTKAVLMTVLYGLLTVGGVLLVTHRHLSGFERRAPMQDSAIHPNDLATPEGAFVFCRQAFRKNNTDHLRHCLSPNIAARHDAEGENFVHLWQFGFSVCGGYGRTPTGVVESGEEAFITFEPIDGCINDFRMIRTNDGWKFDEEGIEEEAVE